MERCSEDKQEQNNCNEPPEANSPEGRYEHVD